MTASLRPAAALARAVALIEARGFTVAAVNQRGDSVYLVRDGAGGRLRVSNHVRTKRQRLRHPEVAASLVIRASLSEVRLEERVAAVLRDFEAASQAAGSASASLK